MGGGFVTQRITDRAWRTDRVGESITLVRCWHVQNSSIGGVILNQDTPGGGDVSVAGGVWTFVMQRGVMLLGDALRWEAARARSSHRVR